MTNRRLNMPMLFQFGLTLIDLLMGFLIVGILAVVAVPSYQTHVDRVDNELVVGCIRQIELVIDRFYVERNRLPDGLDEISLPGDCQTDAWGNPFRYLKLAGKKGKGGNRKDRSENPLNADYDLYSMGKDGKTSQSLRPKVSHDDIIRARNGTYIGLAEDY